MYKRPKNAVHRYLGHLLKVATSRSYPWAIKPWRFDSLLLLLHQQVLMFPEALADAGPCRALGSVFDAVAYPANKAEYEGDQAGQLGQGPASLAAGAGQFGANEAGRDNKRDSQNEKSRPLGGLLGLHCCSFWNNPA